MKKKVFSVLSILIVMVMVCSVSQPVFAASIKDLQNKVNKLEQNIKDTNNQLANIKTKINQETEKQRLLSVQIMNVQDQISLYKEKIKLVEEGIAQKEKEIDGKSKEIIENENLFSQRVRAMYMSGTTSVLQSLLGAKSFSELFTRAELLKRISVSDQQLIDELTAQKEELTVARENLKGQNADLKSTKSTLDSKQSTLDGLKKQSQNAKSELQQIEKKYMEEKVKYDKQIKAAEKDIARIIAEEAAKNQGKAPEGAYKWPVANYKSISSGFGWRVLFGQREMHWGIDISANAGNPISAAHNGKVIIAQTTAPGWGYGNYVVIDHGGGYTTLYGHMSSVAVSVGQIVTRGQNIGGIGTTGTSTGNHLHFEVRVGGDRQNPMGYVKEPR